MADTPKSWKKALDEYENFLRFEKNLADNSVKSYMSDLGQLAKFAAESGISPIKITPGDIDCFIGSMPKCKPRSQARLVSSMKGFFNYLLLEDRIKSSPVELISTPKIPRTLPDVLTIEEVDALIAAAEQNPTNGTRNGALLEMLYSSGLRVSELTQLRFSDVFVAEGVVRVVGKGDKQRLVPISQSAVDKINAVKASLGKDFHSGYIFVNNKDKPLSRVMVFYIIREAALRAGISKSISPHTLRHSFATHLLAGGASISQVQEMLGHRNITTTEIYTHINITALNRTLEEYHPLG